MNARVAAVVLAGVAGCASAPADPLADARLEGLRGGVQPALPWAVAFGPTVDLPPSGARAAAADELPQAASGLGLEGELARAAGALRLFAAARAIPAAGGAADEALDAAAAGGDELFVRLEVRDSRVAYVGRNVWWLPNILLWLQFWVPSFFVPDEDFAWTLDADLAVYATGTGRCVFRRRLDVRCVRGLDDFERGWDLLGVFRPGAWVDHDTCRAAADTLRPHMVRECLVVACDVLGREFVPHAARAEFREAVRKTLVVAVGVSRYADPAVGAVPAAARDAAEVASALAGGRTVPSAHVSLRQDAAATGAAMREAVRAAAARCRPGDDLVLFFAGRSALIPGTRGPEVALAPHDARPGDAATLLPLREWAALAAPPPGARCTIILDTSPGGGAEARGVPGFPEGAGADAALDALVDGGDGRVTVLLGAGPAEPAAAVAPGDGGLFAHCLTRALREADDADGDGRRTLQDAFLRARERTTVVALLEGRSQTPRQHGAPAAWPIAPRVNP